MHTITRKTLYAQSLQVIYVLMILSILLTAVGISPVSAAPAGTALQFNGSSQYVTFGSSIGTTAGLGAQVFTLETWFKKTGTGATTSTGGSGTGTSGLTAIPLVTKGRGDGDNSNLDTNYFLGIDTSGVLAADFEECASATMTGCPAGGTAGLNHPVRATTVIANNVWYHAAVSYDGRYWKIYLNGVLEAVTGGDVGTNRLPRWDSIEHAGIGTAMTSTGVAGGYFAGVIDEVRIWNVARAQTDIQADMYKELTSGIGLIGRWGLNENTGTTANNSIVGRPNGTLTSNPTWVAGFPMPDTTPPAAPTALSTTPYSGAVSLSWTAPADLDVTGYNVYRSTAPSVSLTNPINGGTLVTGTTYSDSGRTNGTPYYYVVTAVDTSTNQSVASNEVNATPLASLGSAVKFDGINDYVTFGPNLNASSFTLEAWVKRDAGGATMTTGSLGLDGTSGRPLAYPVLTKGMGEGETPANVNMNWFLGITTTGVVGADFEDNAGGVNHPAWGTTIIPVGEWHHIAATYTGSCWALYVDGTVETLNGAVTACPNALPESTSIQHAGLAAGIGSTGQLSTGFFAGTLEEARVWNVVRTQEQIRLTINSELTTGSGLIARWGMNEGTGTIIASSVGTFPGTLTNGPTWISGSPFNIVFDTTPPAAPIGLSATPFSGSVSLSWTANTETDLAGYNLYRGTSLGGPYVKINTSLLTALTYADGGLTNGTPYYYVLRAVDTSNNESGDSNEASTTPLISLGAGLIFDGTNDYVTFGAATSTLGVQTFTIETWFKKTGVGTYAYTGDLGLTAIPLVTKGMGENDGVPVDMNYFLGIDQSGVLAADFEECAPATSGCPAGGTAGLNHPVKGTTVIQNDVWYHVAVAYDGRYWTLYLNGIPETTMGGDVGAIRYPRWDSTQHAGLGSALQSSGLPGVSNSIGPGYFAGMLDEVRIWNRPLSQSEIRTNINLEVSSATNLIGRWGMNDGSGLTATNAVVGSPNGTLTNGPAWTTGAPFNLVFDSIAPDAPTNLMSSPRPGAALLEWTANTESDLAGYRVYRSSSSPVVKGTPINGTLVPPSFTDSTVTAGTTYYYAVTAVDTSGNESALSNEVNVVPLPPPPAEALDLGSSNAYVALGDNADTTQFTLETWLRRDGAGVATTTGDGGQTLIPLITNGTAETETAAADINYFFGIRGSDGVLCADFEEGQTGASAGLNHPICGVTPITNGAWYHAAVTYSGTTWRLYLNGNLDAELVVGQPVNAANTSHLAFGTSLTTADAPLGYFDGALDEVRIWNYARSQAQIASTINSKLADPQTGLLGRWGLDEASGAVANDTSGYAITGTITGTGYSWIPGSPFNATVNLSPEIPSLVEPLNNASNVPTTAMLSVNVTDPENSPLNVTFYGRPLQAAAGPDFTIAVIPDPQYYASTYPSIYNAQMQWLADNKTSNNIIYVAGLGDNVDVASNTTQWTNANTAWSILETGGLAYGLAAGNHDGAPSGTATFNSYFGASRFTGKPYYGGHYGSDNDNHYALFSASGMNFIVVFIEYDDAMTTTDHPVLQWTNGLLQTYSNRRAIVISHNMLNGGTSTTYSTQGQTIYNALKGNPNLFLMLGGHLDVAARRTDTLNGNTVYTLRSDYQSVDSQQSGYLRLMRFSPTDDMIYVRTYSPTQNKDYDKTDAAQSNFVLPYAMDGTGFSVIGTANGVTSGSTASVSWANLDPSKQYEWFVIASDGTHQTSSDTWNFTTASAAPTCYALTLSHTGEGSNPTASPANSTGCPVGQYIANEAINLSGAVAATGWQISSWTGTNNNTSTSNTNTLTMPASAQSASVNYSQIEYSLTYIAGANGSISGTSPQTVNHGANGTLVRATPDVGYHFVNWSDGVLTAARTDLNVTGNISVTATFAVNNYTLTYTAGVGGIIDGISLQTVNHGANGTLVTAIPDVGYHFVNWSDGVLIAARTDTNVIANKTVSANFTQDEYTLTIVSAHGTVTKTPNKLTYVYGEEVTLSVTADIGWTFTGWMPALTANKITITGDTTVTANFTQNEYTLNVISEHGAVTRDNTGPYHLNDVVTLNVTADAGWTFTGWTPSLTDNKVTITGDTTVIANYSQDEYTLTVISEHGTVTRDNNGPYHLNDVVMLTVAADTGWIFTGWTPALTDNKVTITGDTTITANYSQDEYLLTVISAHGTVTKTPNKLTYTYGEEVTLSMVADTGWTFSGWTPSLIDNKVIINGDTTVTAVFSQTEYALDVTIVGNGSVTRDNNSPYHLNDVVTLTPVAAAGWTFTGWTPTLTENKVTISGDTAVTATFTQDEYSLTLNKFGEGTVSAIPANVHYHFGDEVELTAVPSIGWSFESWSANVTAGKVTITGDTIVTANFTINSYTLTYVAGANGSIVGATTQTVNYGADGSLVTATPAVGYHFVSWSDGYPTPARTDLNVTENISVTANFAIDTFMLNYTAGVGGTLTGNPSQTVSYGEDGTEITAVPDSGYRFVGWSDGVLTASRTDKNITSNLSVTANFAHNGYTLNVTVIGSGSVSKDPDSATYLSGSIVQLTASPAPGWSFSGWSGDVNGSTNPLVVTMNGNVSVTANYSQNDYTLTINTIGNGSVTTDKVSPYHYGDVVELTASPDAHWSFSAWSGDLAGSVSPATITINGNKNVTATFTFVNSVPVANDQVVSLNEDNGINVTMSATDADGDPLTFTVVSGPVHGSFNGTVYTPFANYYGADAFTFKANDGRVDGNTATVTITVIPVNDTPVAVDDNASTSEGTPVTIDVLVNDTDLDGDALSVTSVGTPAHGSVVIKANVLEYTPTLFFSGTDEFTYVISDGNGGTATAKVTLMISATNDAPIAGNDTYITDEDTLLGVAAIGVLTNDSDPDGDVITAALGSDAQHGVLNLNPDGSFTYTPNLNFNGVDSFTYRASDGLLDSIETTVTITVNAINDVPVANAATIGIDEDTSIGITLTGNDVDGDALNFNIVTSPVHGALSGTASDLIYTPDANYNGTDSFTFEVSDGFLNAQAQINITVNPVNDAPVAVIDTYETNENVTLNIAAPGVLANDTDVDGDALTAILVAGVSHGTLTFNADGSFAYVPNANYNGPDGFSYKANDRSADSNSSVTIKVNLVNYAPSAFNDQYNTNEDTALIVDSAGVLSNDTDSDGDTLTAVKLTDPAHGVLTFNADGSFAYTPEINWYGIDSFIYKATDGLAESNIAEVTILVKSINDAPKADSQSVITDEDAPKGLTLTSRDVDGNALIYSIGTAPVHGMLSGTAPNLIYTPNADFFGEDAFTFTVNDGQATSDVAMVSINVNPINDEPVCLSLSLITNEDAFSTLSPSCADVDSATLSYQIVAQAQHGTAAVNLNLLGYSPHANYNGMDSFTYKASDGLLESNTALIAVTVISMNDAPSLIQPLNQTNTEGDVVSMQLVASDPEDDAITYVVTGLPQGLNINATTGLISGTLSYTSAGVHNVNVTAKDGYGDTISKNFTWTVMDVRYTLTVNITGNGGVNRSPNQTSFDPGTMVTLTAVPANGWVFSNWSGGISGTTNPQTIMMDASKTVTATFTQIDYILTVNVVGSGSVAKSPNIATYHYGDVVQLTGTPAAGWMFTSWSGDLSGTANPASITINGNKSIIATFTQSNIALAYGIHDESTNNTQVFTINTQTLVTTPLGSLQKGFDIESLDMRPTTGLLYATSGPNNTRSQRGYLFSVNKQTGALTAIGSTGYNSVSGLSFRNDGVLWGWASGKGLMQISLTTGKGAMKYSSSLSVGDIAWSNDGRTLYIVTTDKRLYRYNPARNTLSRITDNLPSNMEALDMRSDGLLMMGVHDSTQIRAYDPIRERFVSSQYFKTTYNDVEGIAWP